MISLYLADVSGLPDPLEHRKLMQNLPFERQIKIQKLRSLAHRKQSLGTGLLLRKVLQKHDFSEAQICLGPHGKPECEGLQFNVSHSGNLVACAIGDTPVGCDVEQLREAPRKLANRFFSEQERLYLNMCDTKIYDKEFYRLWTMKESYMKFTGEGMSLPLNQFQLCLDGEIKVLREGCVQNCYIKEYKVQGYQVTVCAEEAEFADIVWENLI